MPWNPISKYPEIIQELKKKGYFKQVTINLLETTIQEVLGVSTDKTTKHHVVLMVRHGFIKLCSEGVGIFEIVNKDQSKEDSVRPSQKEDDPEIVNYTGES